MIEACLKELGYPLESCMGIGNHELGRHTVFQCGDVVIKFYGNNGLPDAQTRASAEAKYSRMARERFIHVPVCIKKGVVQGQNYSITQFMRGRMATREMYKDPGWMEKAGELLGRLHAPSLTDGFAWFDEWVSALDTYYHTACRQAGSDSEVKRLQDVWIRLISAVKKPDFILLPMGLCHGDYGARNIMILENGDLALLDFELSYEGNTEREIAFFIQKELGRNSQGENAFLNGYCRTAFFAPGFDNRLKLYQAGEWLFFCSWQRSLVPTLYEKSLRELETLCMNLL